MIRLIVSFALLALFISSSAQYSDSQTKMGRDMLHSIMSTQGLYENRPLLAWVISVGRDLELSLDRPYRLKYYIIDSPIPNAFATPGGYIYVTRGLLALVNTDDELAGILAHEFMHATNEHASKRVSWGLVPKVLKLPANLLGVLTFKEVANVINMPIEKVTGLAISAYSRSQEKEADLLAVELMLDAYYDPNALVHILKRIRDYLYLEFDIEESNSLFGDHPMTDDRIKYLEDKIFEMGKKLDDPTPGTTVLDAHELLQGQNPEEGLENNQLLIHPYLEYAIRFPPFWEIQRSPVNITAVSPDKKAVIILSIEHTIRSVVSTANYDLNQLEVDQMLINVDTVVNGYAARYARFVNKRLKYPDQTSQIIWASLEGMNTTLKIVSVYNNKNVAHHKEIESSIFSLHPMTEEELVQTPVPFILLHEASQQHNLEAYLADLTEKQKKLFGVLNSWRPGMIIPEDRYIKTVEYRSF